MDNKKIKAFDYMLHLFFQWRNSHKEVKGKPLPKLTAMKMLFLVSVPKEDGGFHVGTQIESLYCHKATVEELIEHFSKK